MLQEPTLTCPQQSVRWYPNLIKTISYFLRLIIHRCGYSHDFFLSGNGFFSIRAVTAISGTDAIRHFYWCVPSVIFRFVAYRFGYMIKRPATCHYPELAPLYNEHTDGLQFVQHLRLSVKRDVAPARMKDYSIWYWQHHIKPHFFQEEKILIPCLPADDEYVMAVLEDHREIRSIIHSMTHILKPLYFLHLANLVEAHIRFEEERFFPDVAEQLSPAKLREVGQQLAAHPVNPGIWEDAFWYE